MDSNEEIHNVDNQKINSENLDIQNQVDQT